MEALTVKEIRLTGIRGTRPEIVRSQLFSEVGQPFHHRKYLNRLGVFTESDVVPLREGEGVVLDVRAKEMLQYLPYPSVSLTEENGISAGGGFKSVNFRGKAVSLSIAGRFGGETAFEAQIRSPWRPRTRHWYAFDYFHRDRDNKLDRLHDHRCVLRKTMKGKMLSGSANGIRTRI